MNSIVRVCLCVLLMGTALVGCAQPGQERLPLSPSGKAMSPVQLARYSDSFDRFRDDLYDLAAMTWNEEQMDNLCLAETAVIDGKLKIQTKPGCFSRGGLGSRYEFKGSFDVQIDCSIRFLKGVQEMDQIVLFLVGGKGSIEDFPRAVIQLAKFAGSHDATISSLCGEKGRFRSSPRPQKISDFNGTLRIIKVRDRVTTLYKKDGEPEWTTLNTDQLDENRLQLWFVVRNFIPKRTAPKGSSSMIVTFDNLVVNAAEEIIEGEI